MGVWRSRAFVALTAVAAIGCAAHEHVRLRAPRHRAPALDRLAAYDRLRADPEIRHLSETFEYLRLANGTRVYHPEGLLRIVPPRSRTARAASRTESMRHIQTVLLVIGGAFVVVGSGMTVHLWSREARAGRTFTETPWFALTTSLIGVGVVLAALSAIPERKAIDAAAAAFESYDRSLRRRLDLCVAEDRVVDCAPLAE